VGQQQLGEVAVRALIPVHAIPLPVLPRVAEVEMEVQHVEAVPGRRHRAVEVGLHHIFPQVRGAGPACGPEEAPGDNLGHWHGRVPHQQAGLG
jgi:hypothetical protein